MCVISYLFIPLLWIFFYAGMYRIYKLPSKFYLKKTNSLYSLFPVLIFSSYPVLHIYFLNLQLIPLWGMIISLCCVVGFSVFIFFTLRYLINDNEKSSILTVIITVFFYQYGYFTLFFGKFLFINLLLFLYLVILKTNTKFVFKILMFFACSIFLMNMYSLLHSAFAKMKIATGNSAFINHVSDSKINNKKEMENIYIILLDSYPSNEILKQEFKFDNKQFIDKLKKKGFFIYESIFSNYTKTYASVPSFLNFKYLESFDHTDSCGQISDALLFKTAAESGYNVSYINTFLSFSISDNYINNYIDLSKEYNILNINDTFFSNSLYWYLFGFINKFRAKYSCFWETVDYIVEHRTKKPELLFAHLLSPHFPYVKDKDGNNVYYEDILVDGKKQEYLINKKPCIDYLIYTNNKTLETVDKIFKKTGGNARIIILGDHGLRLHYFFYNERDYMQVLFNENNTINSFFNTFLAYYSPSGNYEKYKDKKSLINFFITFSNEVFDTSYPDKNDEYNYVYSSMHSTNFAEIEKNIIKLSESEIRKNFQEK